MLFYYEGDLQKWDACAFLNITEIPKIFLSFNFFRLTAQEILLDLICSAFSASNILGQTRPNNRHQFLHQATIGKAGASVRQSDGRCDRSRMCDRPLSKPRCSNAAVFFASKPVDSRFRSRSLVFNSFIFVTCLKT